MKLARILVACVFVVSIFASWSSQAADCPWDVVGTSHIVKPAMNSWFEPDGVVTFNAVWWWEDDTYACYKSYTTPFYRSYFPGCDLNGDGVFHIDEVYEIYYYASQTPANPAKPIHSTPCPVDPSCVDLDGTDWGSCAPTLLGVGVVAGSCSPIFGCEVPPGVALYATMAECDAACDGCADSSECAPFEYCEFADYTCGSAGLGSCEPLGQVCSLIYDPVCTCDYQIAGNACQATVMGASIRADGECAPEDVCNYNGGTWTGTDCDCPVGEYFNYQRGCEPNPV